MKWFSIISGILFLVLIIVGLILPSTYRVERSIVIMAPVGDVFDQVNDLRKNENWSPWKAKDSSMVFTYGDITVGEGATYSWKSKHSGMGTCTISESIPQTSITMILDFKGRNKAENFWHFEKTNSGVKVTEGFSGDAGFNLFSRYFNLLMDHFVGPKFENGLSALKKISEASRPVLNDAMSADAYQ